MKEKKLKLRAKDRASINAVVFYDTNKPKGVIIVCHGFGQHIKSYEELARYFTDGGYICVIFDQRGHGEMEGLSTERRAKQLGIIPNYECFLDDIEVVKNKAKSLFPELPLILYGHSMGGNIVVSYLLRKEQNSFKCAVLETPWLRLYKPVSVSRVLIAKILGKLNPNWAIINKLDLDSISRDENKSTCVKEDELYHNRISFRMFTGINYSGEYAIKNASKLTIPILLVRAGEDKIVCPEAINEFNDKSNSNIILKSYEDAYHSVHSDIIKETYYKDVIEYINSQCN